MTTCRCVWDCSHAWCGCPAGHALRCVCGVRPSDCPVHNDDRDPAALFANQEATTAAADEEIADLMEQGRQLASRRDELIAGGVDPYDLAVPIAPYDPNIVGEITLPATAKLQPGDLVRIIGPGSWEIEEPPKPAFGNDAIDAPHIGQVIHDTLTEHPDLQLVPDPDDPWKLTRIYKCKGCGDLIDLASAPKQFGSVQWCLNAHQAQKIVEALARL